MKPIKLTFAGKNIPRGIFADPDKDGYPNPVDCSNRNRRKQGELAGYTVDLDDGTTYSTEVEMQPKLKPKERLGQKLSRWGAGYKEWKEKHRQKQLEDLAYKTEKAKLKGELYGVRAKTAIEQIGLQKQRLSLQKEKFGLMQQRQKAMGSMPSMFGSMGGGKPMPKMNLMNPLANLEDPKQKKEIKHRKKTRRKARKRKAKYKMVRVRL